MSIFKQTFRSLIIGGLFFIVPLLVMLLFFKKAIALLFPPVKNLVNTLGLNSLFGVTTLTVMCAAILVLICYLSGLLLAKGFIKQWSSGIEEKLFLFFPGIQMLKYQMIEHHNHLAEHWQAILLKEEKSYRIAFITDLSDPTFLSVFIPDAPKMDAGEIRFIEKDACTYHQIPMHLAMKILSRFGRQACPSGIVKQSPNDMEYPERAV